MMDLQVSRVRAIARDVLQVELRAPDGRPLPGAEAGAHIELHLPNGLVRQYSLTHAAGETTLPAYQIAVGLDAASRGGSSWIHEKLRVGSALRVGAPRNLFALDPAHRRILLLAGGIGITPIFAMAQAAQRVGVDWQLLACARSIGRIAFAEELLALAPDRVQLHGDLEAGGPADLAGWLNARDSDGVYACGPLPMLVALEDLASAWPAGRLRVERFKAPDLKNDNARSFELILKRSGLCTQVAADEPVLTALGRLGVDHPSSCREGLCGTCECGWIEGDPDHRDQILDASSRSEGRRFIPCVSRSRGERLTLDL